MRGSFGMFGKSGVARAAIAAALATGIVAGGMVTGASSAIAKEAKATNSPEFVKVAGPFQKTMADLQAKKGKVSDADLKAAASAVVPQLAAIEPSVKTPADRIIFGQWQQTIGGMVGDNVLTQKGLQNMLDSGQLPADKVSLVGYFLGAMAYQNKDYAGTVKALTPVVAANYADDSAAEMLAVAYTEQGQPAQGLDALKAAIAARTAANGTVPDTWYRRANNIAYNAKLGPQAIEWSTLMVQASPTPLNWLGAGQLVREFGSFGKEESLDLGRLFDRTGALGNDAKFVEREYIEYVESADPRRFPGEVVRIIEKGVNAGVLKPTAQFVTENISQAKGRIAEDKGSLPASERAAKAGADGKLALATADAYLSYGEGAKAEELYRLALQKSGIDKDRAQTRLGIALSDQGKFDDAKAAFAQVTGTRAPLAKLWSIYVTTKGAK